jgi:hypothetical protein
MKEIGLWGEQGTHPPPGPKKSGVVAYCLVSVPHRGQVLTSHFCCGLFMSVLAVRFRRHYGHEQGRDGPFPDSCAAATRFHPFVFDGEHGREPGCDGGAVGLSAITLVARSKRRPGDGKIAVYAINRHRHVIDAGTHYSLPMEADGIALAIFCSVNDSLCDELVHSVKMREVPKRTTSLVKRGPHCADRLVIKDKE